MAYIKGKEILFSASLGGKSGAKLQEKTITKDGEYTADEGFDGFSKVTIKVSLKKFDGTVEVT